MLTLEHLCLKSFFRPAAATRLLCRLNFSLSFCGFRSSERKTERFRQLLSMDDEDGCAVCSITPQENAFARRLDDGKRSSSIAFGTTCLQ